MAPTVGEGMVTPTLKLPIIVVDKGGVDLSIYDTLEKAERHLEPIDVRNGEYVGYDAEGRLLCFEVESMGGVSLGPFRLTTGGRVVLKTSESEPTHCDELCTSLRKYLEQLYRRMGLDPEHLHILSLQELIVEAVQRAGFST